MGPGREAIEVTVPAAADCELHLILTVRDTGSPNLFAYRRVVLEMPGAGESPPPP